MNRSNLADVVRTIYFGLDQGTLALNQETGQFLERDRTSAEVRVITDPNILYKAISQFANTCNDYSSLGALAHRLRDIHNKTKDPRILSLENACWQLFKTRLNEMSHADFITFAKDYYNCPDVDGPFDEDDNEFPDDVYQTGYFITFTLDKNGNRQLYSHGFDKDCKYTRHPLFLSSCPVALELSIRGNEVKWYVKRIEFHEDDFPNLKFVLGDVHSYADCPNYTLVINPFSKTLKYRYKDHLSHFQFGYRSFDSVVKAVCLRLNLLKISDSISKAFEGLGFTFLPFFDGDWPALVNSDHKTFVIHAFTNPDRLYIVNADATWRQLFDNTDEILFEGVQVFIQECMNRLPKNRLS